jgi:hypothetical protein
MILPPPRDDEMRRSDRTAGLAFCRDATCRFWLIVRGRIIGRKSGVGEGLAIGLWRWLITAVVGTALLLALWLNAASVRAIPPPFVTILFSRSQWAVQENCNVPPGAITLQQVAADLHDRGDIVVGSLVTSWIHESSVHCTRAALYPSLDVLKSLHTDDGWEAISHSATHPDMTRFTTSQQFAESFGTPPTFVNHGFNRAWGMFAYPNNKRTTEIQTSVASTCFAFGRKYSPSSNKIGTLSARWWAKVKSVNGGE